jgi:hypothetical protein
VEVMLTIQIMWMRLNGMKMIKGIGWTIILIICVWGSVNLSKEQVRIQMALYNMKIESE